jgi:hypothetical protein
MVKVMVGLGMRFREMSLRRPDLEDETLGLRALSCT